MIEFKIGSVVEHPKLGQWRITDFRFGYYTGRDSGFATIVTLEPVEGNTPQQRQKEMSAKKLWHSNEWKFIS